jgi:hypothetical protein
MGNVIAIRRPGSSPKQRKFIPSNSVQQQEGRLDNIKFASGHTLHRINSYLAFHPFKSSLLTRVTRHKFAFTKLIQHSFILLTLLLKPVLNLVYNRLNRLASSASPAAAYPLIRGLSRQSSRTRDLYNLRREGSSDLPSDMD